MIINGYKIFNPDWKNKSKRYYCPGEFHEDVTPEPCEAGMHFCQRLIDCLVFYPLERLDDVYDRAAGKIILKVKKMHVAKVCADDSNCVGKNGNSYFIGDLYATSDLKILYELDDEEIKETIRKEIEESLWVAPLLIDHPRFRLTQLELENYHLTIEVGNIVLEEMNKLIGLVGIEQKKRNEVIINDYQRLQDI